MKILMAASEVVPFAKTGGLADVAGALPLALEKLGHEVAIIMPRYKVIPADKFKLQRVAQGLWGSSIGNNIKVYFVENDAYFNRDGLYGDKLGDHKDNLDRFSFYCKRSLELLKEIKFRPDVIHVHDWQACLIPVFLKTIFAKDPFYQKIKTVLTIHNIGYQGLFDKEEFTKLGLSWDYFSMEQLEFYGRINILKGGMVFSDIITTVSPTYSKEIQTKEFGFGLEGVLEKKKSVLFGILNGLDYTIWNPETDPFLAAQYSANALADKAKNKENLQKACKLPVTNNVPLIGIVSRLAEQKGFDILSQAMEKICSLKLQMVILGTGDNKYHVLLEKIAAKYPKVISLNLRFDDQLAHNIYAGSDLFLMPSQYEPCGLGQLISLRYGTIPIVYKTGGLADTVTSDNGFVFDVYSKEALLESVKKAIAAFKDSKKWPQLVKRAMAYNFSWEASAKQYVKLYEKAKAG